MAVRGHNVEKKRDKVWNSPPSLACRLGLSPLSFRILVGWAGSAHTDRIAKESLPLNECQNCTKHT